MGWGERSLPERVQHGVLGRDMPAVASWQEGEPQGEWQGMIRSEGVGNNGVGSLGHRPLLGFCLFI